MGEERLSEVRAVRRLAWAQRLDTMAASAAASAVAELAVAPAAASAVAQLAVAPAALHSAASSTSQSRTRKLTWPARRRDAGLCEREEPPLHMPYVLVPYVRVLARSPVSWTASDAFSHLYHIVKLQDGRMESEDVACYLHSKGRLPPGEFEGCDWGEVALDPYPYFDGKYVVLRPQPEPGCVWVCQPEEVEPGWFVEPRLREWQIPESDCDASHTYLQWRIPRDRMHAVTNLQNPHLA